MPEQNATPERVMTASGRTGTIHPGVWDASGTHITVWWDDADLQDPPRLVRQDALIRLCPACKGSGDYFTSADHLQCPACQGTGSLTPDDGGTNA